MSVCVQYAIKIARQMEQAICTESSFDLPYTVLRKFGYLQNKNSNFSVISGYRKNFATAR